ncbi:MAG: carbohydrate-binding domain-containing protein [Solobacterium sp.]|jgi:hypothetical protein|nr:carbohydrate-binding domain-containing protein [Solobacterium sp.]MCH4282152.1 carbohydrate-binding domain-containing protein [Solobacterium sp.]
MFRKGRILNVFLCIGLFLGLAPVYMGTTVKAANEPVTVTGSTSYSAGIYTVDLQVSSSEGYTVSSVKFNNAEKQAAPYSFTVTASGNYDYTIAYAGTASGTKDGIYHVAEAITSFAELTKTEYTVAVGTTQNEIGLPATLPANNASAAAIDPAPAVTWNCADYDANTAGTYTFTAVLAESAYILADGTVMPSVAVKVEEDNTAVLSDNAKTYIAAVKSLNKGTIISAVTAWAADSKNEDLSNAADAAMAPVIAADDLYTALSDKDKSEEAVAAAYAIEQDIYNTAAAAMPDPSEPLEAVEYGDFSVITAEGSTAPTYADNILTFANAGTYTVSMKTAGATTVADRIEVTAAAGDQTATDVIVNITLDGVNINVGNTGEDLGATEDGGGSKPGVAAFSIESDCTTNITLIGTNTLLSGVTRAGLHNGEHPLTINGDGTLTATGGVYAAGIGGNWIEPGSNITIFTGTVNAISSNDGAGIGGGAYASGNNITINGGIVKAKSLRWGAGIGGGRFGSADTIKINGGTVDANGGDALSSGSGSGAGIGGGYGGDGSNITISGGIVNAHSGNAKSSDKDGGNDVGGGAGIGGGAAREDPLNNAIIGGNGSNITITGGTVTATGYTGSQNDESYGGGAGIGGGFKGTGSDITISGGTVTAKGKNFGRGIGGGYKGTGSDITISGGIVTVESNLQAMSAAPDLSSYIGYVAVAHENTVSGQKFPYNASRIEKYTYISIVPGNNITKAEATNGSFNTQVYIDNALNNMSSAAVGEKVYIIRTPDTNYELNSIEIKETDGERTVSMEDFNSYFTMPNYPVTVTVTYKEKHDLIIDKATGYTYSPGMVTITEKGTYEISMHSGIDTTTDYINVAPTTAGPVTIILNNVTIDNSKNSSTSPSFIISNTGTTTVTLAEGSTNTLKAGGDHAGLENGISPLIINGKGTLNATGRNVDTYCGGAGIGGGYKASGKNITIESGTVNATGAYLAAGIGGGQGGSGENITILQTDGSTTKVTAKGGSFSAGIGGGSYQSGSNITISSGTVKATGGQGAAGIGGGYGEAGNGNNIKISGGTVTAIGGTDTYSSGAGIGGGAGSINVSSITITDGDITAIGNKNNSEGALGNTSANGDTTLTLGGTWYRWRAAGSQSALNAESYKTNSYTSDSYNAANQAIQFSAIPTYVITKSATTASGSFAVQSDDYEVSKAVEGASITIVPEPAVGYVMDEITVTKTGDTDTIVPITNNTFIMPAYPVTVTVTFKNKDLTVLQTSQDGEYTYIDDVLNITKAGDYTVSNTNTESTADHIVVSALTGDVNITLNGVNISSSNVAAFAITGDCTTNVILADNSANTLKSGAYHAGLENGTHSLNISVPADSTKKNGTLNTTGGIGGAGIGGGKNSAGKNIMITAGTITAVSPIVDNSAGGAGIGGGYNSTDNTVTIIGGDVTAIGDLKTYQNGSYISHGALGNTAADRDTTLELGDTWYKWRAKYDPSVFTTETYSTNIYDPSSSYDLAAKAIQFTAIPFEITSTSTAQEQGSFTVTVDGSAVDSATARGTVEITPAPATGYVMDEITVTKTGDTDTIVPVTNNTFIMPAYPVTITVTFVEYTAPTVGSISLGSDTFIAGTDYKPSIAFTGYKPTVTINSGTITDQGWQWQQDSGEWAGFFVPNLGESVLNPDTVHTYKLRYFVAYNDYKNVSHTIYSNDVTMTIVGRETALALTANPESPHAAGTEVILTASLTGYLQDAGLTNQFITFKNGAAELGTAALDKNGIATLAWTPSTAGVYSLSAKYAASSYNNASSGTLSYTALESYAITKVPAENGSFTVKAGNSEVIQEAANATVTIIPTPADGYLVDTVTVKQTASPYASVNVADNTFTMPAYPVTVTVTFSLIPTYSIRITAGRNMTRDTSKGSDIQIFAITDPRTKISDIVYTADDGYYFPENYTVISSNNISVTRNSSKQITISGQPSASTNITLINATGKTALEEPVVIAGNNEIKGTTDKMEYSLDGKTWKACNNQSTPLSKGTYYVRYKATDTKNASEAIIITISDPNKGTQDAPALLTVADGKLMNTTAAMEYSLDGINWLTCADSSTSLSKGTYCIRYKETDTKNASEAVIITIPDPDKGTQDTPAEVVKAKS